MADEQQQAENTPEQLQAGVQVAGAATQAAQAEPTADRARAAAARAARRRASEVNIQLSEEDAKLLATAIVNEIEARGGFDAPPEPITAPPAPPPATQPDAAPPAPPRKPSFAERFRGR